MIRIYVEAALILNMSDVRCEVTTPLRNQGIEPVICSCLRLGRNPELTTENHCIIKPRRQVSIRVGCRPSDMLTRPMIAVKGCYSNM